MVDTLWPLTLNSVTLRRRGKAILNGLSHRFDGQGVAVVIGPNGAGKTSLLRAMHGLERLTDGSITWAGPEADARAQQAFVFQRCILLRRSVLGNLSYAARLSGMDKPTALAASERAATEIGLKDAIHQPARRLSGGEQQKLALAAALIRRPKALFLDEPTSNLDGRSTREIETMLLAAKANGIGIILATHDMAQARRLGQTFVFLQDGEIADHGRIEDGAFQTDHPACLAFLRGDIVE